MKHYIAMSKRDKDFIIMREDVQYNWFKYLPDNLDFRLFHDGTSDTVYDWLSNLDTNGIQLLVSFDDYDVFKLDYPELFI